MVLAKLVVSQPPLYRPPHHHWGGCFGCSSTSYVQAARELQVLLSGASTGVCGRAQKRASSEAVRTFHSPCIQAYRCLRATTCGTKRTGVQPRCECTETSW